MPRLEDEVCCGYGAVVQGTARTVVRLPGSAMRPVGEEDSSRNHGGSGKRGYLVQVARSIPGGDAKCGK